jgi:hypothetical protein
MRGGEAIPHGTVNKQAGREDRSSGTLLAIRSRKAYKSSSGRKTPQEKGEDPLPT